MYNIENFHKLPKLYIYDLHDNKEKLDKLYDLIDKQKMELLSVSKREYKTLESVEIHNLIKYEDFMKGKNKPFKRIVTAYLINKLVNDYPKLFSNRHHLSSISKSMEDKLQSLLDYRRKNYSRADEEVYKAMLEVAEENNLFDYNIYTVYNDVKSFMEKLPFIERIMSSFTNWGDDIQMREVLRDILKYYKVRLDYQNYNIKLNEDETEEKLTEEIVEELV